MEGMTALRVAIFKEAEPLNMSGNSKRIIESESSLPCSQNPTTGCYFKRDE
jgi:hypothetical protein